jgi:hypothetical protein
VAQVEFRRSQSCSIVMGIEDGCCASNSNDDPNEALLLDCCQNAARMGHVTENEQVLFMLLDLGIVPDFTMLYHATLNCSCAVLRRCLSVTTCKDSFSTCAAHALHSGNTLL